MTAVLFIKEKKGKLLILKNWQIEFVAESKPLIGKF